MKITIIALGISLILTACSSSNTVRTANSLPKKPIVTANQNADVIFNLGVEQEKIRSYHKAATLYKKAAELGSSKAKNNLGSLYEKGLGITKDPIMALRLYRQAAEETGDRLPIRNLANMYYFGLTSVNRNDTKKAFDLYKIAAKKGDSISQNTLGTLYQTGDGTTKNHARALFWFQKAANQNNTGALINLASAYMFGKGVTKSRNKTIFYYKKAAKLGSSYAIKELKEMGVAR